VDNLPAITCVSAVEFLSRRDALHKCHDGMVLFRRRGRDAGFLVRGDVRSCEGRASKRRLRGQFDRGAMLSKRLPQVTIVDRQGLIAASCECYQLIRSRFAHHLPKTYT
jgi:hypothetical protein